MQISANFSRPVTLQCVGVLSKQMLRLRWLRVSWSARSVWGFNLAQDCPMNEHRALLCRWECQPDVRMWFQICIPWIVSSHPISHFYNYLTPVMLGYNSVLTSHSSMSGTTLLSFERRVPAREYSSNTRLNMASSSIPSVIYPNHLTSILYFTILMVGNVLVLLLLTIWIERAIPQQTSGYFINVLVTTLEPSFPGSGWCSCFFCLCTSEYAHMFPEYYLYSRSRFWIGQGN